MKNTENIECSSIKEILQQRELFIATLIHDLKTPLQAQIISLEQLKNGFYGNTNDKQKEILNIILESANFMNEMLFSVLEIYKLKNGAVELKIEEINIDYLIKTAVKEITSLAISKNIKIKYINTLKYQTILTDKMLLRRVISNMLNNGINYAYKNTDYIIELCEIGNKISLTFKNTGYTIPIEIKEKIFDKFVTSGNLNTKIGSGLGLYYCKKVIEALKGSIELNSKRNENVFIIILNKKIQELSYNKLSFI